jgi:hypothetical protein
MSNCYVTDALSSSESPDKFLEKLSFSEMQTSVRKPLQETVTSIITVISTWKKLPRSFLRDAHHDDDVTVMVTPVEDRHVDTP